MPSERDVVVGEGLRLAVFVGLEGCGLVSIDEEVLDLPEGVEDGEQLLGGEGTDANVVALAERLGTDLVISLDRHHMCALRMKGGRSLRVIPE